MGSVQSLELRKKKKEYFINDYMYMQRTSVHFCVRQIKEQRKFSLYIFLVNLQIKSLYNNLQINVKELSFSAGQCKIRSFSCLRLDKSITN